MSTDNQLPPGVTKNAEASIPLPPLMKPYAWGRVPPGKNKKKMHALTHEDITPAKQRANQLMHYRNLVARGDLVMADAYARERSLDVPLSTLTDELVGDAGPVVTASAPPPPLHPTGPVRNPIIAQPTSADPAAATLLPWPENVRAVVWTTCPNPKLVVIRLPDGRTASLWREGLPGRPVGIECDVHLEKRTGDPIYRLDEIAPIVVHPNA